MAEIFINPKERPHFITYIYCKQNNIPYVVDLKAQLFDFTKILEKDTLNDVLIKIVQENNFKSLKEDLQKLEKVYSHLNIKENPVETAETTETVESTQTNSNENDLSDIFSNTTKRIFLFLFSNKIFPGLFNKNQLESFGILIQIYDKFKNLCQNEMSEFQKLKLYSQPTGTLSKTTQELKNKDVITRFPPEPSGYIHLGHVKALLLNENMAHKNNGKMVVRFDDTNPLKESQIFVDAMKSDITHILGISPWKWTFTSDYFEQILEKADFLIQKGLAYCDNTDQEQMARERFDGVPSKCRSNSVSQNFQLFRQMKEGKHPEYCLRAKIDHENVNKAMRDPVIYRFIDKTHHKTGTKYRIYPTYDFACPIVDSLEGISHSFRTNEYRDRNSVYYWFIKNLELQHKPTIKDFSKLSFENTVLSKRKLKKVVEDNGLEWCDPRMPTLRGIRRLGLDISVLKSYILSQGITQKNSTVSWDKIWAENKIKIDKESDRYYGIETSNMLSAKILNFEEMIAELRKKDLIAIDKKSNLSKSLSNLKINNENLDLYFEIKVLLNRKNPDQGSKNTAITPKIYLPLENVNVNDEITLMNLGNFIVKNINDKEISLMFNKNGDFKKTALKLQWVSQDICEKQKMVEYGDLFDKDGNFNKDSMFEFDYICEAGIKNVKDGQTIQIERMGFFYKDGDKFNLVPFTKQARKK
ncbi:hypothetical protein EDEG_02238 [Edhazardia aedis USNM 41457]|uniref:Glutamate--tRNA ligase n=1 Tax=Edhazardia aedis (strain USNM 41457) TaxID=1003232 RepID=J8ZUQ6_EDHAE|nr:hypothetical protein EDEG_02238 [Edhazardia aedis USNM 41457]|eukprot:EJW03418.1 hypothetical protein EDEG_02238 [Edhazardia aedis USNM 41457]